MSGRPIANQTYIFFAKKYNIPLKTKTGRLRTMSRLSKLIYQHEMKNKNIKSGLYVI
jgi:hypothetical protein